MHESWFTGEPPHKGFPLVLGLITLDGKVQVRREVDAGNQRRDMMRDSQRQNHQKADTCAGAKTVTLVYTAGQRETRRQGLRILARIIARAHLRRRAHCDAPRPDP